MKDFLIDLIDNDTLIIVGLFVTVIILKDMELAKYVAAGLVGYMSKGAKGKS